MQTGSAIKAHSRIVCDSLQEGYPPLIQDKVHFQLKTIPLTIYTAVCIQHLHRRHILAMYTSGCQLQQSLRLTNTNIRQKYYQYHRSVSSKHVIQPENVITNIYGNNW